MDENLILECKKLKDKLAPHIDLLALAMLKNDPVHHYSTRNMKKRLIDIIKNL